MKTITVEKVFIKDMTSDKGPWKSYRVKEVGSDRWYGLKGWGKEDVKEGDVIHGTETSREYNGTTYYDITLNKPNPELDALESRVTKLEGQMMTILGETPTQTSEVDFDLPF